MDIPIQQHRPTIKEITYQVIFIKNPRLAFLRGVKKFGLRKPCSAASATLNPTRYTIAYALGCQRMVSLL